MAELFARESDRGLDADARRALVALSLVPGVGGTRARAIVAAFGDAAAAFRASAAALRRVEGVGPQTAAAIRAWDDGPAVDAQFARADAVGAELVAFDDDAYPARLREVYDPPAHLWVRGRLDPADTLAVAVVGTRKASDYGKRVASAFAEELARAGVTVVSGLAYGIDIAAHRAAVAAGGRTVAVLGSGVDVLYPARHAGTVREILDRDLGAVVSELPLGAAPDAANFPRRNRIVSGMSLATVVAEARETGGALLTAALALEQNRGVFAVPGSVFADAPGANRLIQAGAAALVMSAADVLAEVAPQAGIAPAAEPVSLPADLTAIERRLLDALSAEPRPLDAVCADADLDTSSALVYLLQLEFRGLVRQLQGKQFFRT
ncbi:DNA-processing protein DprA [Rubrivirga sp. IMCC45206]|uniref:DNA-processing protein DprA n=1 Tax=Rubrivirga sp. IMCC45206 TaxID=3391614 RepID=UPI00398FE672